MQRNILKIQIIYFCSRFHFYLHVYALLLQSRGLTLLQISTIESVVIASMFLMEVPTGVLADRIARKWSVTGFVFLMMCGELLFLFSRSYPLYLVVGVLTGTGFAFGSGAVEALIYDSLPKEDRENRMKRVMGNYGSIGQIAFFLSPIIGALIVSDLSPERFNVAIALTAGMLFIGFLVSLTLQEPKSQHEEEAKPGTLTIFREGLAEIRANVPLRRLVLMAALTTAFTGALITTYAAPYMNQNRVSPFMIGLALSAGSLLAAVTQRYAYRMEQIVGKQWGLLLLTLLPGLSYLVLAFSSGGMVWLVIVWMYGTNDIRSPLLSAYQNALINTRHRATTLSLINMVVTLFVAVVGPMYGAIATRSIPLAFMTIGGVILLRINPRSF